MGQQVVLLAGRVRADVTAEGQFDSVKALVNQELRLDQKTGRAMSAKV